MTDSRDPDRSEIVRAVEEAERLEREERHRIVEEREEFEGLQVDPGMVFYPEIADRKPGDKNIVRFGFDLHPQVTAWSAGFLIVFLSLTLIYRDSAEDVLRKCPYVHR